jgi:hypothetical protein
MMGTCFITIRSPFKKLSNIEKKGGDDRADPNIPQSDLHIGRHSLFEI